MKDEILSYLNNPAQLERLYRNNKTEFKTQFQVLYPTISGNALAECWNERLNYETSDIAWGTARELTFVLIASLIAGFIAKLTEVLAINPEIFYPRNIGFIIFPVLTAYFIWRKNLGSGKALIALAASLISVVFINMLPGSKSSDTLILSCIHMPLFLWAVLGFTYVGENIHDHEKRIDFLRYNGDLAIMMALMMIAGGILTGITIGLFSVIGFNIENFYMEYIAVFGLAALPMVATYIVQTNPQLVNRVSPVIAKIFSPLVLIMLVVYLVASLFSGKDPYKDRDFLMVFNFLLIGVMAIIFFSVAGTFRKNENRASGFILFALSIVTILVNGIALSAILFRIAEWGLTPNRLAVLGANVLMLLNLLMASYRLYMLTTKKADCSAIENSISRFLPIYWVWVTIVTFAFPLLFRFK